MPTIKFINEKMTVEVPEGTNLRKAAISEGISLYPGIHKVFNCRGFGQCGSCRVYIKKGMENTSKMSTFESLRCSVALSGIGHEHEMRLACMTNVNGDIEVETRPPINWHGEKFWG